ncbi:MAG TPA: Ca2+-dependent phosphoinositide-specific phospholipase C, partial [Caulobacteraceae bacterium]
AETVESRANDTKRRDAAFLCGAQYVSTDYRRPDTRFSDYQVRLPGDQIAVANPQRAPERCAGVPIEP